MRVAMGIIRNQHGVFHLRKKVPKKLEEAVALVTGSATVSYTHLTLPTN